MAKSSQGNNRQHLTLSDRIYIEQDSHNTLDERYNNPPGTMFLLQDWYNHKEGYSFIC